MIDRRHTLLAGLAMCFPSAVYASDVIHIPLTFTEVGKPLIDVMINAEGPYSFVIDTGASTSGVRDELAQTLKLPVIRKLNTNGLGGKVLPLTLYSAHEIVYGTNVRQANVALTGFPHFGVRDGRMGILPAGFLTTLPSQLDYEAKELRLYRGAWPDLNDFTPVKSYLSAENPGESQKIYLTVVIDGDPLKVLLDTGSSDELLLFPRVVKSKGLWNRFAVYRDLKRRGVTGATTATRLVTMPNFAIGDIKLDSLPVMLMDPAGHDGNFNVDGILGTRFLSQYTLAVNGSKGIALKANSHFVAPVVCD
jgi:predicted aspartyl protease